MFAVLLTGEFSMSCIEGATKYLTFSSIIRYLPVPLTMCFPGAPVRGPPGKAAALVPRKVRRKQGNDERDGGLYLCKNPCCLVLGLEAAVRLYS